MNARPPHFSEDDFRTSSFSNPDQDCVDLAYRGSWVEVRDSKTAFGAVTDQRITLTDTAFHTFLAMVTER